MFLTCQVRVGLNNRPGYSFADQLDSLGHEHFDFRTSEASDFLFDPEHDAVHVDACDERSESHEDW